MIGEQYEDRRVFGQGAVPGVAADPRTMVQAQQANLKRAPLLEIAGKRAAENVHGLDAAIERLTRVHDRLLGAYPEPPVGNGRATEKGPDEGMLGTVMHMLDAQQARIGVLMRLIERLEQL